MDTRHRIFVGDSGSMDAVADSSVELVVTSPPYPMIEMWDELFCSADPAIEDALDTGAGQGAFERMHAVLDRTWAEVARVLAPGGIACVNVGDATRRLGDTFRVYPNHARVQSAFVDRGFTPLPGILWRKPANSAAKFMGSGMVPPNAYATLEHEHILVLRNGPSGRDFEPHADRRYEAAYFWEERNDWFSDLWTDVRGTGQRLEADEARERSAAYPFAIPYRLINMYSVYGDTVLDPFWGTGTTTMAAMVAGRDSVGYETDAALVASFDERVTDVAALSRSVLRDRLEAHREFIAERVADGNEPAYEATHYDFPVVTKQEREIRLYRVASVESRDDGYRVTHEPMPGRGWLDGGG